MGRTSEIDRIFYASLSYHELFKRTVRKTLPGVTKTQMDIAVLLGQKGSLNMSAIGELLGISREQVTRAVKALAELGVVTCSRDEANRRSVAAHITERGKTFLEDHRCTTGKLIEEQLAALSASEVQELAELSERANALLLKASNPPS